MSPSKKIILMVFIMSSLAGCKEDLSYTYLVQHPKILKQEMDKCETMNEKTQDQAKQCDMVMYAAAQLTSIINEQQSDPEKFGQHVMDIEAAYAKSKAAVRDAQQTVDALKTKQASATELQAAEANLKSATNTYQTQRNEMKMLLAILGMASPE